MLGRGCRIVYSNLLNFKKDLEVRITVVLLCFYLVSPFDCARSVDSKFFALPRLFVLILVKTSTHVLLLHCPCSSVQEKRPEYLIAVPRLYESLHKTIASQLKSQTGLARRVVDASMAVTGGYTAARDVFKGLIVGDKQPSVVAKVSVCMCDV